MTGSPVALVHQIPTSGNFDDAYFEDGIASGVSGMDHYLSGGYFSDLWVPRMTAVFDAAGVRPGQSMLDFGCGAGYATRSAIEMGIRAVGLDVSSAALNRADPVAAPFLAHRSEWDISELEDGAFDFVFAKDVLEHVPHHDLGNVVSELLRVSRRLFVCVPIASYDGGPYLDVTAERDVTHVVRLSARSWCDLLGGTDRPRKQLPAVCEVLKGDRSSGNLAILV